ncbi:hypothetical protein [Enterococcus sp. DIV0806c]|uniref:hypothetical protein n=1 Tax=unclassified Enterococcus TaxID=2608891 RepID=UPI003F24D832
MIPKFRAWDKETQVLINVLVIDWLNELVDLEGGRIDRQFDEVELMQSTGLKGYMDDSFNDDGEKEVFKGDVIDIFWEEYVAGFYQENHLMGVVDLNETGTAWIINKAKYDYHNPQTIPNEIDGMSISRSLPTEDDLEEVFLHAFNLTADDITILGNIYENPELLGDSK